MHVCLLPLSLSLCRIHVHAQLASTALRGDPPRGAQMHWDVAAEKSDSRGRNKELVNRRLFPYVTSLSAPTPSPLTRGGR